MTRQTRCGQNQSSLKTRLNRIDATCLITLNRAVKHDKTDCFVLFLFPTSSLTKPIRIIPSRQHPFQHQFYDDDPLRLFINRHLVARYHVGTQDRIRRTNASGSLLKEASPYSLIDCSSKCRRTCSCLRCIVPHDASRCQDPQEY